MHRPQATWISLRFYPWVFQHKQSGFSSKWNLVKQFYQWHRGAWRLSRVIPDYKNGTFRCYWLARRPAALRCHSKVPVHDWSRTGCPCTVHDWPGGVSCLMVSAAWYFGDTISQSIHVCTYVNVHHKYHVKSKVRLSWPPHESVFVYNETTRHLSVPDFRYSRISWKASILSRHIVGVIETAKCTAKSFRFAWRF